jgi:diguanylate cyclase (GGDEF)-like protein
MNQRIADSKPENPARGRAQGLFLGPAIVALVIGWTCLLAAVPSFGVAVPAKWAVAVVLVGACSLTAAAGFLAWRVSALSSGIAESQQLRERLSVSDALTGSLNHSAFMDIFEREFARCQRYGQPLAIMLLDIDFFKRINAGYGHAVGDDVLRAFVGMIAQGLRNVDPMGRLGGKDFAILLPNTAGEAAVILAERLRESVTAVVVRTGHDEDVRFTASVGVSCLAAGDASFQDMLGRAEKALRQAKDSGRNRVALVAAPMAADTADQKS